MKRKSSIPTKPVTERSVPHSGHVMGGGPSKGLGTSRANLVKHDGFILGSGKGKSATPAPSSIDRLPNDRTDGRII